MKSELEVYRCATAMGHAEISGVQKRELPRTGSRQVLQTPDRNRKLYSNVVAGCADRKYKFILTAKANQPPDIIKKLLKSKVNPTEIKVGITILKSLRDGRIMIEARSKNEI